MKYRYQKYNKVYKHTVLVQISENDVHEINQFCKRIFGRYNKDWYKVHVDRFYTFRSGAQVRRLGLAAHRLGVTTEIKISYCFKTEENVGLFVLAQGDKFC